MWKVIELTKLFHQANCTGWKSISSSENPSGEIPTRVPHCLDFTFSRTDQYHSNIKKKLTPPIILQQMVLKNQLCCIMFIKQNIFIYIRWSVVEFNFCSSWFSCSRLMGKITNCCNCSENISRKKILVNCWKAKQPAKPTVSRCYWAKDAKKITFSVKNTIKLSI